MVIVRLYFVRGFKLADGLIIRSHSLVDSIVTTFS